MGTPTSAWLRDHGWWLSHGASDRPTHLLLDGGKARVPDDSGGAFLNAYAIAVVRKLEPCIVELRTPVFRLFVDLDVKTSSESPLDVEVMVRVLQRRVSRVFAVDNPRAVVCSTQPKPEGEIVKSGKHVVWTNVLATTATALAFRDAAVEDLEAEMPGACTKPWATVVDVCVFTSNGLRMPFSGKGRGNSATYVPSGLWSGEEHEPVGLVEGVSAVRRWVHELSIRTFGCDKTPLRDGVVVAAADEGSSGLSGTSHSLRAYEAVLPLLDAALPVQFAGQRFTGLFEAESCFLLRSSSRYCLNLGRAHNSCGIYWILSRKGVRQGCYCRCDTVEGRTYGLCRDFKSDVWPVANEVIAAFFGAESAEEARVQVVAQKAAGALPNFAVKPLPSRAVNAVDRSLCSRPCLYAPKRKRSMR